MLKRFILGAAMAAATTTAANAITVDGTLDAAYGASTASVAYDSGAPTSNFGTPGTTNHNVAYDIYITGVDGYVYGFMSALGDTNGLDFANVYFNTDPGNGIGSDIGFEIGNKKAFIPITGANASAPDILFAIGANTFEFAIPVKYFTQAVAGLNYDLPDGFTEATLPLVGATVQLSLSQAFGYSVAGGVANYGADRLGEATLTAVPEADTWALMLVGFLGAGSAIRMRRRALVRA